jgi:23S rRNA pseudouridine1911/1915/1917 synthase
MSTRELTADRGDAGRRLDLVLSRHLSDVTVATRTRIQRWIADGLVAVNGSSSRRVSRRVAAGDTVSVALPPPARRAVMMAESIPLVVLFEDEHLLIVDKPPGLVCHPTHAHGTGTLMNALLWQAGEWPAAQRPSLVGRLDKWTSGLVPVAKTASVHAALQRTLAGSASVKEYAALVYGTISPERGQILLRLSRDRVDRRRVAASPTTGAFSLTAYELIAAVEVPDAVMSLVCCRLGTGRTHQIRVHLAARGWPIVGDPVYGEPRWGAVADPTVSAALAGFPRQALHASRVAFQHPVTGERIDVESPPPDDMRGILEVVGFGLAAAVKW